MTSLQNKRIVVGVTGGIAAYKSAELVRCLTDAGARVRVVMTRAAERFIGALTLQALSGHPVHSGLLDPDSESAMGHIELARWADAVVIAPASADTLARLSQGRADDLLGALCLATEAPVAVAPAMNRSMWAHPATRDNVQRLTARGVHCFGPAEGLQACGETGAGRMLEPQTLVQRLAGLFAPGTLAGLAVMVTAGPTREAIDPVRFLSNRSSGKMGYALARAAAEAGARVTLISGPVALDCPPGVERVEVQSTLQMREAVLARTEHCDIFIATAAVADYRPRQVSAHKLKKSADGLRLDLVRNPDILAQVAALPRAPFTVGFAAESQHLAEHARSKRMAKGLDMVAANWIDRPGLGFDSDENALSVFWEGGAVELERAPKDRLARELVDLIARRYKARRSPVSLNRPDTHAQDSA